MMTMQDNHVRGVAAMIGVWIDELKTNSGDPRVKPYVFQRSARSG